MKKYNNPIPSLDDECVSKKYSMVFTFEENVTQDQAVNGINELIAQNNGKVLKAWVKMGKPISIQYALPQKENKAKRIEIACTEKDKTKLLDILSNYCPFDPFPENCGEDADCNECIENNVEFSITD